MADPACSANYTAFNAASASQDVALVATGGLLSLVSGMGLALSITIQRYALSHAGGSEGTPSSPVPGAVAPAMPCPVQWPAPSK